MNKYMQTDSRWGNLGYPKAPYCIRNCGCGEVSICNIIIETDKYKKSTPATIQPYCKQYADPNGNGTYWSGIPKMLEHYGLTEVKEHQTMKPLWTELAKGNRVAVFLMGSKPGGTKNVHWTSSGHFVCATNYKCENGKHYVYIKDSYSNSKLRNGWLSYKENLQGDVMKVWSGKLPMYTPTSPYTGGLPIGVVQYGSKGDDVKHLKKFLNWCIGSNLHPTNDKCADKTINALKKWQKQYGIEQDGVWGKICKKKAEQIIKQYAPKSPYYSTETKIGEARCNEFGKLSGGKPGDQTGKEVCIGNWYNGGWIYMFRAKDKSYRDKLAQAMIDTCKNENIGYNIDSPNRYVAWDNAEKNGHKISKIKTKGDTTCSEAVSMCMRACLIPKQYAPRHCDIATLTKVMTDSPYFTTYKGKEYTKSSKKLLPGDILLSSHHTVIVVKSPNAR